MVKKINWERSTRAKSTYNKNCRHCTDTLKLWIGTYRWYHKILAEWNRWVSITDAINETYGIENRLGKSKTSRNGVPVIARSLKLRISMCFILDLRERMWNWVLQIDYFLTRIDFRDMRWHIVFCEAKVCESVKWYRVYAVDVATCGSETCSGEKKQWSLGI